MKTITTILAISLFSWLPNSTVEEIILEEIPLSIENSEYLSELDEANFETLILDEIQLNIENNRYLEELEEASNETLATGISLEEIPLHFQYNEVEDLYELEDVVLEEIPLLS